MTECYCDYEYPTVYRKGMRRSMRDRRCEECGSRIAIGERYEYVFAISDGPFSAVTCERCVAARDWVVAHVPCCCWSHGNLLEDLRETVDEYSFDAPGLAFGFGRRLVAINRAPRHKGYA